MMHTRSYRLAFFVALMLHAVLLIALFAEPTHEHPVLTLEAKNEPAPMPSEAQAIKAVSVDSQAVMETVNRLKEARVQKQQAEDARQRMLVQQAELARKQRQQEQQQLARLKKEEEALALARKKQLEKEQQHLKELAKEKEQQEKRLAEMKKQQQQAVEKLAQLNQKKQEALAHEIAVRNEKMKQAIEEDRQASIQKQQAQARADAAKQAQMTGEVDKYKALITNAISQRWILPETVDKRLSSQFRIRLAPNGAVLEVTLLRSSGDPILDRSAQAAIYKASPLPVPSDPAAFNVFREISLTVRPDNARG